MRPRCAGRECRSPKLLCRSIRFSPNMKQQGGFHGACSCRARTANPFAWNCRLLKLDPALSVGAQGGVRYGFHPMCRTWHIWSLPAAIKPRVSGVRVYCFLFVDFLPMPVDSEYIRCLNARAKMHARDACKAWGNLVFDLCRFPSISHTPSRMKSRSSSAPVIRLVPTLFTLNFWRTTYLTIIDLIGLLRRNQLRKQRNTP